MKGCTMEINERYHKNIDCMFSENDQRLLLSKNISVIGCGGQGGYILEFLTRLGVKSIHFWDGDKFEVSNLNRQNACNLDALGKNKAIVLEKQLSLINPDVQLFCHSYYFGEDIIKDFKNFFNKDFFNNFKI